MFIYEGEGEEGRVVWFTAHGRSVWDIAMYFQKGLIKKEYLKAYKYGNSLSVAVTNYEEYRLVIGDKYHLALSPMVSMIDGHPLGVMQLDCPFEEGSYVASWYRLELESITPETWKSLFGREQEPLALPSESVEYADYEELADRMYDLMCKHAKEYGVEADDSELEDEYHRGNTVTNYPDDEDFMEYLVEPDIQQSESNAGLGLDDGFQTTKKGKASVL
jgi:hypothetical protein